MNRMGSGKLGETLYFKNKPHLSAGKREMEKDEIKIRNRVKSE